MIIGHDINFIYFKTSAANANRVGGEFVKSKEAYKVPINLESIQELGQYFDLTPIQALKDKLEDYRRWVSELKSENHNVSYTDDRLRPYQAVDAEFINKRNHAAVFNEQRTGKTPTTLVAVKDKLKKGIIVCPSGLKLNWQREVKLWLEKDATIITGTPKVRKGLYEAFNSSTYSIIIIGYETLRQDMGTLFNPKYFDVLIADEVHRLRNYKTKQSKAVYHLSLLAESVYALTGTPAVNHPADVYGILKLLRPKKFSSYWQFIDRYFGVEDGYFGKQILGIRKDRLSEFTNMLNDISVNRKRKDVMSWIPKITQRTIPLEFDTKQERHYRRALKEFLYGLEGNDKDIPNTLAQLTRLRQICVDPALLELDGASPKTDFIKEFLDDNTGSVIIFSSFTSYLNHLATVVDGATLLTGEQSQAEKQAAIDAFQRGDRRVLLANIRAGGVGFTLDRADTIIFADRSYNPVDNEQAADRFVPTNPNVAYGAKEIIDLTIKNSVEEGINKLLADKQNIISYVNTYIENLGVNLGLL